MRLTFIGLLILLTHDMFLSNSPDPQIIIKNKLSIIDFRLYFSLKIFNIIVRDRRIKKVTPWTPKIEI